jgi:transposase
MRLKTGEAREFRWQTVVALWKENKKQVEISTLLGISQSSVSRLLRKASQGQELTYKKQPGAKSKLSEAQKQQLDSLLLAGAVAYGFEGEIWTAKRIVVVIEETFGVHYSARQVNTIVRSLGFSKQRFSLLDNKQAKEKLQHWRGQELGEIKKKRRPRIVS